MIVFPPCKINLGLRIHQKRADGYHNLETIFYPIPLCDALEVQLGNTLNKEKAAIICAGIQIAGDPQHNLVLKAYHLLDADYILPAVTFCLYKKTPMGAGLGGGSADGAYAIRLLNDFFQLHIPVEKQMHYAAQLGSDCAFFIQDKPCLGSGRGEVLEPIDLSLKGYWIALVKPDIHVSTREAFAGLEGREEEKELEKQKQSGETGGRNIAEWKDLLINDFEGSVFPLHPVLGEIKQSLYAAGAEYASMSGSGSSLFGLFRFEPKLKEKYKAYFYWEAQLS